MKVLLFGPGNAGKTSLMLTTCRGYDFMKVTNLKPTKGISRENFIFRGVMELNIWDAGGQDLYMDQYFSDSRRSEIFAEITTAVFMVDCSDIEIKVKDIFDRFVSNISEFSPEIEQIYVLLNKIDLIDSREDEFYEILIDNVEDKMKQKLSFTPVSVKIGSAQHRLIEILDQEVQKSMLGQQKLGKIRNFLVKLKEKTLAEYLLFNLPDGLLINTTFSNTGIFQNKRLEFMKFERRIVDNNLQNLYQTIMEELNDTAYSLLRITSLVMQSSDNMILIKEVTAGSVIMAITQNKEPEVVTNVQNALSGENFEKLKEFMKTVGF